jgi:hypothetical protein
MSEIPSPATTTVLSMFRRVSCIQWCIHGQVEHVSNQTKATTSAIQLDDRWQMFDQSYGSQTVKSENITITLTPGGL